MLAGIYIGFGNIKYLVAVLNGCSLVRDFADTKR